MGEQAVQEEQAVAVQEEQTQPDLPLAQQRWVVAVVAQIGEQD